MSAISTTLVYLLVGLEWAQYDNQYELNTKLGADSSLLRKIAGVKSSSPFKYLSYPRGYVELFLLSRGVCEAVNAVLLLTSL